MNKRGSGVGEVVEIIPALVVISIIALSVFGVSSSSYVYEISIRDVEARVMARQVVECLSPEGILELEKLDGYEKKILSYCGFSNSDRFYVGIEVADNVGSKIADFSEGDSGKRWVKELFRSAVLTGNAVLFENTNVEKIVKYNPGYFDYEYSSYVLDGKNEFEGKIKIEVLVNYDE